MKTEIELAIARFLAALAVGGLLAGPVGAADPRSPFARGERLPEQVGKTLDANGDGVVTDDETRQAAAELERESRLKSDRSKAIMEAFDDNQDGQVDTNEAAQAAARARIAAGGIGNVVAEIFAKIDINADGFVSQLEFATVVKNLGVVGELLKPRLVQMFLQIDADRNGAISVAESQLAADYFAQQAQLKAEQQKTQQQAQQNEKIRQLAQQSMARLDGNRNGRISQREARRDSQVLAVFAEVDTDSDKQLSAEEVYRYLERKSSP